MRKKTSMTAIDALFQNQKEWLQALQVQSNLDPKPERKRKALESYEYFIHTYFIEDLETPDGAYIPPANFHIEMAEKILNAPDRSTMLFEWSRSLAKSSTIGFIILWLLIRKKLNFIAYFSNNQRLATILLNNIKAKIENSKLFNEDFGPFEKGTSWTSEFIIVKNQDHETGIIAIGGGRNPRGYKMKSRRPDLIILDDLDDDSKCRNKHILDNYENWLNGSVIPMGDPLKTRIVMVGNRFTHDMLLTRFASKKIDFHSKVNILNDKGESVWPQLWPLENIKKLKDTIGSITFEREFMNNPIELDSIFKRTDIQYKKVDYKKITKAVIAVDPSWTEGGDTKSVVAMLTDGEYYYIDDVLCRRCSMENLIDSINDIYQRLKNKGIQSTIYFESNFGQIYLANDFRRKEAEWGFKLPIIFDQGKKAEKYMRIEAMYPVFERRLIFFNEDIKEHNDLKDGLMQLYSFSKNSKFNDDFADAIEYAYSKINVKDTQVWKHSTINKITR